MIEPMGTSDMSQAAVQQMITDAMSSTSAVLLNVTPTDGQVITVTPSNKKEIFLNLAPSADLASLTINLPANADAPLGQRCFIGSSKQIANCIITSTVPVNNGSLMFSPGDNAAFVRNNTTPQTWSRVLVS